jgi:phosphoribosylamine--glycine ligase
MKILVVGSGGREHALVWKIRQSPQVEKVYCAPGNGGIAALAECVDIQAADIGGLLAFAKGQGIDLTVVGPEAPLVEGIVDVFRAEGLMIFGPGREAARLEGSKVFAKEFMHRQGIPTAAFEVFDSLEEARQFLDEAEVDYPLVVKADGLAAGKGVVICKDRAAADKALQEIMGDKIFKEAGNQVVIEECLVGEEVSILAISDGENYVLLETSQDHKRIFDDDLGPNTGGMGAYSPAPIVDAVLAEKIREDIIGPTIEGMKTEGVPFKGVLYAGLMITVNGPLVLEYNVRFGDPEAQAVLPRLKNDIVELMYASCEGQLNDLRLSWDKRDCVCVVMSSGGYPGACETGFVITGIEEAEALPDTFIFHSGTEIKDGPVKTSGGRVLGVTALGETVEMAIERAYQAVEKIKFEHGFFRRDIGAKALRKMNTANRRSS